MATKQSKVEEMRKKK